MPLLVSFTNLTTGNATDYLWLLGDGTTSTLQHPSFTYLSTGTYTVELRATGPGGVDIETKADYITVTDPPPSAEFTASPTSGTPPLMVSFSDLSSGTVTSWSWSFGDGGSSTAQNPSHTYSTPGQFTVSLTATGPFGSGVETKANYVTVHPFAASTFRNGSGANPPCFTARPPAIGTTWMSEVDSGVLDGAVLSLILLRTAPTSGIPTPFGQLLLDPTSPGLFDSVRVATGGLDEHAIPIPNDVSLAGSTGYAQAMLFIPGGAGQFCNAADLIVGFQPTGVAPTAQIGTDVDSGPPALAVAFSDESTGDVTSWSWDFGDGASSSVQNPSHTYAASGTYTVSLVVTGESGFSTVIDFDRIIVAEPPVAEFIGTPQSGSAPLTATFTDQSSGLATAWSWDFGDGESSSLQNPTHVYALPGTFTVALTATGPTGSSTETKVDFIQVSALPSMADFSGTPLTGTMPLSVDFTDLSVGTITAWSWDFGDGGTSTLRHPQHVYASEGTYTVALIVDGPGGLDSETKADYVTVTPPPPTPDFSGAPLSGSQPLTVTFTDASTGDVSSYSWSFGDGGTSSAQDPSYTYALFGTYTVSLTATGPGGSNTETKPAYVTVLPPPPTTDFSGAPTVGPAPLSVQFSDQSVGIITGWSWDFGDGGSSSLTNPQHTYTDAGTYTVSLSTFGSGGSDTETKTDYVLVQASPLRDGSFEQQLAGGAPLSPWLVSSGAGHLILPDLAPASDNEFPTEGTQWAQVSAAGTNAATPPTNPGGAGLAPVGAAGFSQTLAFEPDSPVLLFRAAFLLGGAAADAGANDFMSVEVSDGTATYNLFYADTFDAFPNTSALHGLPMTATSLVETHLGVLFPSAVEGTALTLSVACGNGGNGDAASLGYVDQFETHGVAGATYFNGSGTNPACYVALPPSLGQTWSADIDHRDRPAATFVVIFLRTAVISPLPVAGFGEFLVGGNALLNFVLPAHVSGVTTQSFNVPASPALIGMASSQAMILGAPDQTLCNGVQLVIGFEPPEPPPQAAFLAAPTTGAAPLTVTFTDQSSGAATSWDWDFGDGGSSTLSDPTHTYDSSGTYSVVLRVTGPSGFDIVRELDLVQIP